MKYQEFAPLAGLEEYVECAWLLDVSAADEQWHRVFPHEHIEIVIGFGDRVLRRAPGREEVLQPRACTIGLRSGPLWLKPTGPWRAAGIRLRPEGAFAILDMNLAELSDSSVPLEALWGRAGRQIIDRFLSSKSPKTALRDLQKTLRGRLGDTRRPHPATLKALRMLLESRGATSIHHLAKGVGWSERTLERRFAQDVGVSPKSLLRTVRFHNVLSTLARAPNESWASLACDCGFSDQSHLVREVRRFAGCSPTRLDGGDLTLARLFLSEEATST
jgi:AraC-like DNA-binding protein